MRHVPAAFLFVACACAPQGAQPSDTDARVDAPRDNVPPPHDPTEPPPQDPDEPRPPPALVAPPAQLRLLNAEEYRNTVRDLLGVEASATLDFADRTTGFDSGAATTLDENLLSILYAEADRLADAFVSGPVAEQFPCFDVANIQEGCVQQIVEGLGMRAHRRPIDEETRAQLLAAWRREVDADDPLAAAPCDEATQPPGHWGDREGRCRPSCGALGGTHCPATSALCDEGSGAVGLAFDCAVCCGPGGAFVDDVRLNATRALVTTLLMSARFLYRFEIGREGTLDMFERASLVSYALTASMPDEALLADAHAGALDEARLREHVVRLLATDRARTRMAQVIQQWVRAGALDDMVKNPAAYPKLSGEAQARALRDELWSFSRSVMFEGSGALTDLLTSPHTYVNQHTAPLYGASAPDDALVRLELDPAQRAGVLTLASVMAVHATTNDAERDRPVKRGLVVFNKLLCGDAGLPSNIDTATAGAAAAAATPHFDALTTREQFEAMMQQDPGCMSCHAQFMPHGFAFGSYDGLGRFRTHQRGLPIDTSVEDADVAGMPMSFDGAVDMMHALAEEELVAACFAKNLVAYTLGVARGDAVDSLAEALAASFIDGDAHVPTHIPSLIEELMVHAATLERSAP